MYSQLNHHSGMECKQARRVKTYDFFEFYYKEKLLKIVSEYI